MFWIALAAQLMIPEPIGPRYPDVRALFTAYDFPRSLQAEGRNGVAYTRITVRPDGSTESCVPEASSSNKELDAYTCAIILKRAKFRPATWIDGTSAYGVIRVPVTYRLMGVPMTDADLAQLMPQTLI
jgi:TonB family protein